MREKEVVVVVVEERPNSPSTSTVFTTPPGIPPAIQPIEPKEDVKPAEDSTATSSIAQPQVCSPFAMSDDDDDGDLCSPAASMKPPVFGVAEPLVLDGKGDEGGDSAASPKENEPECGGPAGLAGTIGSDGSSAPGEKSGCVEIRFYLCVGKEQPAKKLTKTKILSVLQKELRIPGDAKVGLHGTYYTVACTLPPDAPAFAAIAEKRAVKISNVTFTLSSELPPEGDASPPPEGVKKDKKTEKKDKPIKASKGSSNFTVTYTFVQKDVGPMASASTSADEMKKALSDWLKARRFSTEVAANNIRLFEYEGAPCLSFDVAYNPADDSAVNIGLPLKIGGRKYSVRKDMELYTLVEKRSVEDVADFIRARDPDVVLQRSQPCPSTLLALAYQVAYGLPNDLDVRMKWLWALIAYDVKWVKKTTYWAVFGDKVLPLIQKRLAGQKGDLDHFMTDIWAKVPVALADPVY